MTKKDNDNKLRTVDSSKIGFIPHNANPKINMKVPTMLITPLAYYKMALYVAHTRGEVGWIGYCTKDSAGDIIIHDVYLPKQQATYDTCELTPEGLSDLATKILDSNKEEVGLEICNNLNLWGHSHGTGAVFPSAQDVQQLDTFIETGYDWFVALIANQNGAMRFTYMDFANNIEVADLPWKIHFPMPDGFDLQVMNEIQNRVAPMPTISKPKKQKSNSDKILIDDGTDIGTNPVPMSIIKHNSFKSLAKDDLIKIADMIYMPAMDYLNSKVLDCPNPTKYDLWRWCRDHKEMLHSEISLDILKEMASGQEIGGNISRDYRDDE